MKSRLGIMVLMMAMALVAATALQAQVNLSPGVARVSLIDGNVSTGRGDTGGWSAATLNTPLVTGDKISTGANSRAEVQLDFADILRLAASTEVHVANLASNQIQVQVAQGLVDFTVLKGTEAQAEIDTPNVAVHPLEPGVYRIEVISQSESRVTVRDGKAEISTPQGSTQLDQGKLIVVEGASNPQYQIADASGKDSWDQWNDQRNKVIENAQNYQHDNQYYTGAADLDSNGRWQYVPGYDWCWTPAVDAGWVPYSVGRWVWEPFYGWTWVSSEPWGWAPYHYGRWFSYGGSWMWWPGPVTRYYRPVWAPAYVSFFGFGVGGFHVGFGAGFGRVGWLPVGPCDPFFPWYGRGRGRGGFGYNRIRVTNITNISNINNIRNITNNHALPYVPALAGRGRPVYSNYQSAFSNAHVRRAIMTVPAARFGTAAVRRSSAGTMSVAQLRQASLVSGHVPVVPTRASLSASGRPANRTTLPSAAVSNRRFFTVRKPGASPAPFRQQAARVQRMVQANHVTAAGRTNTPERPNNGVQANSQGRSSPAAARNAQGRVYTAGPANTRQAANGPTRGSSSGNRPAAQPAANNGWRRFGAPARGSAGSARTNAARPSSNTQRPAARSSFYNNNSPVFNSQRQSARPAASSQPAARPGWRTFSGASNNSGQAAHPGNSRAPQVRSSGQRSTSPNRGQGSWQRFSSRPSPASGSNAAPRAESRGSTMHSFSQPSERSSTGAGQRPALRLSRPIVTGRSSGNSNYRGSWSRGYTPAPSRSHSAPRVSNNSRGGGGSHAGRSGGGSHGGGGSRGGGSRGRR